MKVRFLSAVALTLTLIGCAAPTITPATPTPTYTIATPTAYRPPTRTPTPTPIYQSAPQMPAILICSQIPSGGQGYTYNNLTIGLSTFDDVLRQYSDALRLWDPDGRFLLRSKADIGELGWYSHSACFRNEILVALSIFINGEFPQTIEDWVDQFGPPDRVTWGVDICSRSVIWADRGLLVYMQFGGASDASTSPINVLFVPPVEPTLLEGSWLLAALPAQRPEMNDFITCDFEAPEDPWGVERPAP